MQAKPYQPINCAFYDELEAAAIKKQPSILVYIDESEAQQTYSGKILDFFIRDKMEYMVLENEIVIRLDHILSLDGKINPLDSSCGINTISDIKQKRPLI